MQESHEPKQVRVLEYAAPPVFFVGSYRYRSAGNLVASITALVFAGGFAAVAVAASRADRRVPGQPRRQSYDDSDRWLPRTAISGDDAAAYKR